MTKNQQKFWLLGFLLAVPLLSRAQSLPPTLTSISPNVGGQGATVAVTLTGTGFFSPVSISVLVPAGVAAINPGVTVTNIVVVSSTQITANFVINSNATLGAANVTVTASGGTSGPVSFTINPPPPTLTSIVPNSGAQSTSVSVTLTGTNFGANTFVIISNEFVSVTGTTVVSSTQITATFAIG